MTEHGFQERAIKNVIDHPSVARAECRPMADGSVEVWCYRHDSTLMAITTVFASGNVASRPGWRTTIDTYVGPPEGRPPKPTDTPRARWS